MNRKEMDRKDWLIKFRRAKCNKTLDVMRDAALREPTNIREIGNIILAHEKREDEIEAGLYCRKI
ncbi:hypothetical protein GL272_20010 [Aeromonas veronii]|uniref:hypothetical protein n=1 Tax=Aeromonas TaxID=642 RepID=UPI001C5B44E6|nr:MULTISPECIES: hypothetical protein [Aeromonas]MBW3762771.1 hypothetical protein [Aeromonas jandaei]MBW3779162.1 hypothetical protein [Aeromonas veronii]